MRVLPILCLAGVIAACTLMERLAPDTSPSAIRDAYLIAHGMAQGYSGEPQADPAVLAELARLDGQAAAAVRTMGGDGSPDDSERAVAALTDYAARQTTVER